MSSTFSSCSIYSFFPPIVFISFSLSPLHLFFPLIRFISFPSSSLSLFPLILFISFSSHPLYLFFPSSSVFPPPPPFSSSLSLFSLILFISFSPHPIYLFSPHLLYLFFLSPSLSLFPLILCIFPPPSSSLSLFPPHPLFPFILIIQDSHRLEKYLKMKGSLEKSLKTKFVLKSP